MGSSEAPRQEGPPPPADPVGLPRRLARLLVCVLLVALFVGYVGPWLDRLPFTQPLVQFIDARGIDADALFYTDLEESVEADFDWVRRAAGARFAAFGPWRGLAPRSPKRISSERRFLCRLV